MTFGCGRSGTNVHVSGRASPFSMPAANSPSRKCACSCISEAHMFRREPFWARSARSTDSSASPVAAAVHADA
eukprot:5729115-Prymnesium_polylepis.2